MTDRTHAVIDRIVDGVAVVLVGDDEAEAHVPVDALPEGTEAGAVLDVEAGEPLTILGVADDETRERRERLAARLARLRDERDPGRFPRDTGRVPPPGERADGC